MKYTREEIMSAFDIITCTIRETDELGTLWKNEILEVLNEYFDMIEK